jgi:glycosyltransferase involved in cell wall biosynthesis
MASNKPIVASNLNVIREYSERENATLFDPSDERTFLSEIKIPLDDKEVARKITTNAQHEIKEYTWYERHKAILSFRSDIYLFIEIV